jgi:hypothetical protein
MTTISRSWSRAAILFFTIDHESDEFFHFSVRVSTDEEAVHIEFRAREARPQRSARIEQAMGERNRSDNARLPAWLAFWCRM